MKTRDDGDYDPPKREQSEGRNCW